MVKIRNFLLGTAAAAMLATMPANAQSPYRSVSQLPVAQGTQPAVTGYNQAVNPFNVNMGSPVVAFPNAVAPYPFYSGASSPFYPDYGLYGGGTSVYGSIVIPTSAGIGKTKEPKDMPEQLVEEKVVEVITKIKDSKGKDIRIAYNVRDEDTGKRNDIVVLASDSTQIYVINVYAKKTIDIKNVLPHIRYDDAYRQQNIVYYKTKGVGDQEIVAEGLTPEKLDAILNEIDADINTHVSFVGTHQNRVTELSDSATGTNVSAVKRVERKR